MEKTWKYNEWVKALKTSCPPENYEGRETIGYRWVFEPIMDERNFLPQYFKVNRYKWSGNEIVICQALGLSFFETLEAAILRFNELKATMGMPIYDKIATHVAVVKLAAQGGVSSQPDKHGHFTFHPYETADLALVSEIVHSL
ncbi:MAG: hypothetical protein MUC59_07035 [Saprospiraceae bacterium]|jgi:hypothetical protein|nr:hypothetical protein [Saprospiraceae bacterium]